MVETIPPERFHEIGWRIVREDAATHVRTGSLTAGAGLADAVAALAAEADRSVDIDLRSDGVTVRLRCDAQGRFSEGDVELARTISDAAAERGTAVDLQGLQRIQVAIDALVIPDVLPFWRAVLGYREVGEADVEDPDAEGPPFWFQQMDVERPQRNRIHIDLYVPHDEAETRVAAAIAAGGHIVSDENAPGWWTLADPEGNEVDVACWPDRA